MKNEIVKLVVVKHCLMQCIDLLPFVPLIMWMLSPAVILVWASEDVLVPGITMSTPDRDFMSRRTKYINMD